MASALGYSALAEYSIPSRHRNKLSPVVEHSSPPFCNDDSAEKQDACHGSPANNNNRYSSQSSAQQAEISQLDSHTTVISASSDACTTPPTNQENDGSHNTCYPGCDNTKRPLMQVDGVTVGSSSSDMSLLDTSAIQEIYAEVKRAQVHDSLDEILDFRLAEVAEEFDELHASDDHVEEENQIDTFLQSSNDNSVTNLVSVDASSTSSVSGDGDSVIYMGPREAFKGVEELVVIAQESICLQKADSFSEIPSHETDELMTLPKYSRGESPAIVDVVPSGPRASSADSGVSSAPDIGRVADTSLYAVVAIDLGTTHSGYAYSLCRESVRQVHIMRRWEGADSGLVNHKTPTALLLTPAGAFHSFGSAARDFFHDLPATEARRWLYFDRFKMTLHRDKDLHRETPIPASNGKTQPAISIFAHALKHFRDLSLRELSERFASTREAAWSEHIRWVLTVPAIWRQPARQLVREAAYQAGLCGPEHPDRLLIALEPEAAAVQCREQILQEKQPSPTEVPYAELSRTECAAAPTCFLVADCGGGTLDITLHEVSGTDSSLKELLPASGGPYGSTGIDQEFETLLSALFGVELMAQFRERRPAAHAELLLAFEGRKRSVTPDRDHPINIFPPYAFIDFIRKQSSKDVEYAIRKNGRRDISWCREGYLRFQSTVVLQLFKTTVQRVVKHIAEVLDDPILKDNPAKFLFLVGGFSESEVLQCAVRDAFQQRVQVIAPQVSSLATLRGAVLYGLDMGVISARRAKHSYGVGVLKQFVPGLHPPTKLVISRDGARWCADLLDCFVTAGQQLSPGHAETRRYVAAQSNQSVAVLNIYCAPPAGNPNTPQVTAAANVP